MTEIKRETYRKVTDGLARSLRQMGADSPSETADRIASKAAPRAERRMKEQSNGPPPMRREVSDFLEDGEVVREEIELPRGLVEGADREAKEIVTGGRSKGNPTIAGIRDTPFSRAYFASRERDK